MLHLAELTARYADELFARLDGPFHLRFILQPAMGAFFAIRDGRKDAAQGRRPHLWTIVHDPTKRGTRLRESFHAVSRVILMAGAIEIVYELWVIEAFRPLQMLTVVFVLAVVPYFLVRGPVLRLGRWWRERQVRGVHVPKDG
jgi:hypothetical protein